MGSRFPGARAARLMRISREESWLHHSASFVSTSSIGRSLSRWSAGAGWAHGMALRGYAEQAFAAGATGLRIDLRHCTYMDSTFLGTLLFLKRGGGCGGAQRFRTGSIRRRSAVSCCSKWTRGALRHPDGGGAAGKCLARLADRGGEPRRLQTHRGAGPPGAGEPGRAGRCSLPRGAPLCQAGAGETEKPAAVSRPRELPLLPAAGGSNLANVHVRGCWSVDLLLGKE